MTPICFYHRADYDGVCSAAIVKKFVPDCELYGIDYGDPFPWDKVMDGPQVSAAELEAGSGLPRRQVFMVDFSLKPDEMKRLAKVSDLVWIDHHKSAIDGYNRSAGFGMCPHECLLQSQFSACELCWLWFTGQSCDLDSPALEMPEAVRLLGRYDVWDAENPEWDRIEAFQFGMRSLPAAMDPTSSCGFCWNDLLSGGLSCAAIADRGYAILSYRDQEAKTRKPKTELPYVVGQWLPDGKFKPCDVQPAQSITQFDEIVRWAVETLKGQPDQYNFVRRDPRTLQIVEQRTIKGTLV